MTASVFPTQSCFSEKPDSLLKNRSRRRDRPPLRLRLQHSLLSNFKCLCLDVLWKAETRISVDLACLERINNRKEPKGGVVIRSCAKVTPSRSGALSREVNGRSEVSELVFTEDIMVWLKPFLFTHFSAFLKTLHRCYTSVKRHFSKGSFGNITLPFIHFAQQTAYSTQ